MEEKFIFNFKNFKSLGNVELELKPLTFLFGSNGSGKSSIFKALKFFEQNLYPNLKEITNYNIPGVCDLGSFIEVVNNNNPKKSINIKFTRIIELEEGFKLKNERPFLEDKFEYDDTFYGSEYFTLDYDSKNFEVKRNIIEAKDHKPGMIFFPTKRVSTYKRELYADLSTDFSFDVSVEFTNNKEGKNINNITMKDLDTGSLFKYYPFKSGKNNVEPLFENFDYEDYELDKRREIKVFNDDNIDSLFYEFYDNIIWFPFKVYDEEDIADVFEDDYKLEDEFGFIAEIILAYLKRYIYHHLQGKIEWDQYSPEEKKRIYFTLVRFIYRMYKVIPEQIKKIITCSYLPRTREIPKHLYLLKNNRFDEKDYYGYLYELTNTDFGISYGEGLRAAVNKIIEDFGFGKGLVIEDDGITGKISFISKSGSKSNLAEESSGILQVLPIFIESILCGWRTDYLINNRKWEFLLIEQPELHLHPKLQALLAEFFASDNAINLMIETHSEHIIRNIQVLIAKGKLKLDKLAVYFFDKKDESTRIVNMEMNEMGFFTQPWPEGFFDTSYNLAKELIIARNN